MQHFRTAILIIVLCAIGVLFTCMFSSCNSVTPQPSYSKKRVVILETNTISFVNIPQGLDSIYRVDDTVWVNLLNHTIDDLDTNTMMSVIVK